MGFKKAILLLFIGLVGFSTVGFSSDIDEELHQLEVFSKAYNLIRNQYPENKSSKELIEAAIEGMFSMLDTHSTLLRKEQLTLLEQISLGNYVGIGITTIQEKGQLLVSQVVKNSPADDAGIQVWDVILTINGQSTLKKTLEEIIAISANSKGSVLQIQFYHADKPEKILEKKIPRLSLEIPSVDVREPAKEIVLLTLHRFQKNTPAEFQQSLSGKKAQILILDLRNNPGGLLLSAVEIAEMLLDVGKIVDIRGKDGILLERYVARSRPNFHFSEIYLLLNRHTASSAEILSGALRDRNAAKIIGEKSYGKGTVQTIFTLSEELSAKITTAHYYTPAGKSFQNSGISPDIAIASPAHYTLYGKNDLVYLKALELASDRIKATP